MIKTKQLFEVGPIAVIDTGKRIAIKSLDGFNILMWFCYFFGLVELAKSMFGSNFAGIYGLLYMILGTMIAIWRKIK